ncbi:MAG TPA: S8 family serine peptidase [Roseiflexaceae bacterium]|nr:S8 family serine peptidase [Roseiflexaceae bacterium]
MRQTRPAALIVALALALGALTAQGAPPVQGGAPAIRLKAAEFAPARGERPNIPPGLTISGYAQGQRGYYLVQFRGPVEQGWKDAAAAAGAELLDYVPDFAFKARMNPAEAARVAQLPEVLAVELFHPAYKLSPALNRAGAHPFTVRIERGADAAAAAAQIAASGATVLGRDGQILLVAADSAQLDAIAHVLDVAWVQNFLLPEKHDEYARVIIGANAANAADGGASGRGYDGSTQTAAVADTGFYGGTAASAPADFSGRVSSIFNWPGATDSCFQQIVDDGARDVDSGHGTHVAGSVLSNGASAGQLGRGIAPAARLVFQATENYVVTSNFCKTFGYPNDYYLTGLPSDLRQLFQQAYSAGARIHANSWGSAAAGDYTAYSANADDFIWTHRDMTITFSAGNEGTDANANGVIDNDSIGAPATAKNVITVGASENQRGDNYPCDTTLTYTSRDATYQSGQNCPSMGGQNLLGTYGQRWGSDYPANPIAGDLTAGNQEQMAAFSSRGPTDDGRIKPDVVAPGTWILAPYADLYQEGYGDPLNPQNNAYQSDGWGMPISAAYKYFGGTSMSNPIAAGAATVVRDFYKKVYNLDASAALVKATLINAAVDLLDENNDGANDNDFPIPNNHEGWGRINLDAATDGSQRFGEHAGLTTNGVAVYTADVSASGPVKFSVVWSDAPSTEAASVNLVNDLDVTVTSPGGTTYRGNVFSGGWSASGGSADRRNNVENVYIQSAAAGTWTIEVRGFNVPNGPQPFALVVDGTSSLSAAPTAPAAPTNLTASAASRTQVNLSWIDNANNEDGFRIERCSGKNCTNFAEIATVGANVTSYSNTGLNANTTYRYRVRAFNAVGNSAYSNIVSVKTPR